MSWDSGVNYQPSEDGKPGYLIYDKIMISGIICLLLVAFFVFLLNVYTRWFREPPDTFSRRTPRRSASTDRQFHFTGEEPARLLNVGLDSAILETLPMFVYKSKNFTDGLDCAVCLCEFEEDEKARLLPNCRHSFHVECIDMWFRSHSACPLCRTRAQPEQSVLESVRMEHVSVTIPRAIPSGIHDILNSGERQTASSEEEYNLSNQTNIFSCECGDKQINRGMDKGSSGGRRELTRMPHIAIEIMPKRPDCLLSPGEGHFISSPNGSQSSSKSPVTRLRSLTRMFNRDRETKVFPSDNPAECDAENNEL